MKKNESDYGRGKVNPNTAPSEPLSWDYRRSYDQFDRDYGIREHPHFAPTTGRPAKTDPDQP